MPAPRQQQQSEKLPTIVPQRVNNFISVDKYYRSANLLVRQANEYRARQNELQLYTMLMRLASLVVETIPDHKDFSKHSPDYKALRRDLLTRYMQELEDLKLSLKLQNGVDTSSWMQQPASHTPNTVQISTSNLPQLDWENLAAHPSPQSSAAALPGDVTFGFAPSAPPMPNSSGMDLLTGGPTSLGERSQTTASTSGTGPSELPTFQYNLRSASQAARDRHALLPTAPASTRRAASTAESLIYPQFDASPYAPIDYGPDPCRQGSQEPAVQIGQQMASLDMARMDPGRLTSLMDADAAPRPSPMLGPQELEVLNIPPPSGPQAPGADCCHPVPQPPPPPPPLPEEQPGDISKQREIREVHVSMGLMEEFLAYARSNTRRGIESCGILAGLLDTKRGLFSITTLIVPKQEGTSDTVQALAEEEIFDVQDKRGLYPMGWIHTHPTQTCFLSSIDVHTQCGYQTMLDEAVAIVMAPSDRSKRCGIFRLSTPGGLKLVQKCQSRGFHSHPPTETGQPLYELCGHVYLNERLKHDVVDLR